MDQQHTEFEEIQQDRPQSSYKGYEGSPKYDQYTTQTGNWQGQKISDITRLPSAAQRLALAIVSLSLFLVAMIMAISAETSYIGSVQAIGMLGLLLFFITVIIININFNKKR